MRRHLPGIIAGLAFALVLVGVVVFEVAERSGGTVDFGWSAYAPLPAESYWSIPAPPSSDTYAYAPMLALEDGWTTTWSGDQMLGAALVVVGLLVLTAVGSWLTGRRSTAQR